MIPAYVFEQIHAAPIENIIGRVIILESKGDNLVGPCPWHKDDSPSFTVNPARNIFKCFSCNVAGDSIKFIQEFKGLEYYEAVREVAGILEIQIIEEKLTAQMIEHNKSLDLLRNLNAFAMEHFMDSLLHNPEASAYINSRISEESIRTFKIGYAPRASKSLFIKAIEKGFTEENIQSAGLITRNKKTESIYDFFQDRIIFPITSVTGAIIGFSGRILPSDNGNQKMSKYINTCETLLYSKRESVYGMKESLRGFKKYGYSILVEGPTDVITMHQLGFNNTVACLGTSINESQLKLIQKRTERILLILDGDQAGVAATIRAAKIAASMGMFVEIAILPPDKDPATMWQNADDAKVWIKDHRKDFILFYSLDLIKEAANDPYLKNEAIKELSSLIANYSKDMQIQFVDNISDAKRLKPKLFWDRLRQLDGESLSRADIELEEKLPPGVDAQDFIKYNFFEFKNEYHFGTRSHREKVSNFILIPVFHVDSIYESKRIYELINCYGFKVVVNLDMQEMTSLQSFQRNVEGKGNFLFQGTSLQFNKLKVKLYENTRTCTEITVLGWQKEGFWAWSNGIHTPDGFELIDEYGLCQFKGNNYFIPAFSSIYIGDKQVYIDERKFTFRDSSITLSDWINQFDLVFPVNSKLGIAFWIASVFRDHILHIFKNFPILNMFGPKGAGKSQFARSLTCLFGESQIPYNIHNGTKAGLAEHLQQFSNAFAWIDEYKNALEFDKIETLKSIYDAIGRSRMNMEKGKKKETTAVNSAALLSGQEMPTVDVALFTRVIFLLFNKTSFTDEERFNYDALKIMEKEGLSHFTNMLLCQRDYFTKNFYDIYQGLMKEYNDYFIKSPVEDRILRSVVTIVAAYRTIANVMPDFEVGYDELKSISFENIRTQNNQINQSNEVGQFWNSLESMFDENILIDKWHFRIDYTSEIELQNKKLSYNPPVYILKFKYNAIYNLYAQNSRKQGLKPLPSDTLRYYLSNQSSHLGTQVSCSFTETKYDAEMKEIATKRQVTSAICFIYNEIPVNLSRSLDLSKNNMSVPDNSVVSSIISSVSPKTKIIIKPENNLPF